MAAALRHQASLEGVFSLANHVALEPEQRTSGAHLLRDIVSHFHAIPGRHEAYSKPLLIWHTLDISMTASSVVFDDVAEHFNNFAEYLLRNLFIPLRTSSGQAGQRTPRFDSALERLRAGHLEVGTPDRLSTLRGLCLERDHFRCVVSRAFDEQEAFNRIARDGDNARDDDGVQLTPGNGQVLRRLNVAHILPHALTKSAETNPEPNEAKKSTLRLINVFDSGITAMIDSVDIDRPRNAITLSDSLHAQFDAYRIYFEPTPDAAPGTGTYTIRHFLPSATALFLGLPATRTLFQAPLVDPPSMRFFAFHRAIAFILHLSGAGEHIDELLRDMDRSYVRVDGTTPLDEMVSMRLGGWWDGTVQS